MSYGHSGMKYCDACYCNELDEAIEERDALSARVESVERERSEARLAYAHAIDNKDQALMRAHRAEARVAELEGALARLETYAAASDREVARLEGALADVTAVLPACYHRTTCRRQRRRRLGP